MRNRTVLLDLLAKDALELERLDSSLNKRCVVKKYDNIYDRKLLFNTGLLGISGRHPCDDAHYPDGKTLIDLHMLQPSVNQSAHIPFDRLKVSKNFGPES